MRCPSCGYENLDGDDVCTACNTSLSGEEAGLDRRTPLEARLSRDRLGVLRPPPPVTVHPSDTIGEVLALLARRDIGCALVMRDDTLLGIITERDILVKIGVDLDELGNHPVEEFMTPAPETLLSTDPIAFALNRMAVGWYRHIPIEKDGKTTGVVSVRDVLGYLTRRVPELLHE